MRATIRIDREATWVVYETTVENEPVSHRLWWKVQSQKSLNGAYPHDGDWLTYQTDGIWSGPEYSVYTGPGDTQAQRKEVFPVPRPKVRKGIDLRWYRGRWEKLLKKGWVPA